MALLVALLPCDAPGAPTRRHGLIARNVVFHSRFDAYDRYSDVWGYTAPDGREYALIGVTRGVVIVNITERSRPYEVAMIDRPDSPWRDIQTLGHYAFDVNEQGGGLGIIDLADPEHPVVLPSFQGFSTAHTLFIDEDRALAFVAGSDLGVGGPRIYSLASPTSPAYVGKWDLEYAHEVHERDGLMLVSAIRAGELFLVDVTVPQAPVMVGSIFYHHAATHSAWPTEDGSHVLITDEIGGALCRTWNISNPASPVLAGVWSPDPRSIPHNVFIEGHLAFISYYTAGIRILDVSDPQALVEVAFCDTHPSSNLGFFAGCWGVFPFFPNSPDLFLASDIEHGLHLFELTPGTTGRADLERAGGVPSLAGTVSPNPSRPGTPIRFALPRGGPARASILDACGRLVDRIEGTGPGELVWDGRDGRGHPVGAGVYFVRLEQDGRESGLRVTLVR
ncbi:MAG: choice-of-anchor B family protein [Candidatus Eiseniibacteriota bacterium]